MAKTSSPSRKKSHGNCKANQASSRRKRLERELNRLMAKRERFVKNGRQVYSITHAIEQVEYALTYDRPEGKKGSKGVPETLEIPHSSVRKKLKRTHVRVYGMTALNLKACDATIKVGSIEIPSGWVTKQAFSEYINSPESS